jgi:hypothetical protein
LKVLIYNGTDEHRSNLAGRGIPGNFARGPKKTAIHNKFMVIEAMKGKRLHRG